MTDETIRQEVREALLKYFETDTIRSVASSASFPTWSLTTLTLQFLPRPTRFISEASSETLDTVAGLGTRNFWGRNRGLQFCSSRGTAEGYAGQVQEGDRAV